MMQDKLESEFVYKVAALMRSPGIVPDHFLDAAAAIPGLDEVIAERSIHHHRQMFMLRDGGDFLLGEGT